MYDFTQRPEVVALIEQATQPLLDRIQRLEAQTDEWVDTETAVRLTGRSEDTLLRERRRPGTLIKFGKDGRKNLYQRSSLVAYCEAKTVHYHRPRLAA